MTILGLYHLIKKNRTDATRLARAAAGTKCDPRTAHENGVAATTLSDEARAMEDHARENEELMQLANGLIHKIAHSKHRSRYRSLTLSDLESSINWLDRENGDQESDDSAAN